MSLAVNLIFCLPIRGDHSKTRFLFGLCWGCLQNFSVPLGLIEFLNLLGLVWGREWGGLGLGLDNICNNNNIALTGILKPRLSPGLKATRSQTESSLQGEDILAR